MRRANAGLVGTLNSFRHCGHAEALAMGGPLYRLKVTYLRPA